MFKRQSWNAERGQTTETAKKAEDAKTFHYKNRETWKQKRANKQTKQS